MQKAILFLVFYLLTCSFIFCQNKRDYNWIIGYDTNIDTIGQAIHLNFNEQPMAVSNIDNIEGFWMEGSNTSISDKEGNLLFYSNGCYITNAEHEKMLNGDTINPGLIQQYWCPVGGSPTPQGVISLPAPDNDTLYYLFNLDREELYYNTDFYPIAPAHLLYNVIDMTKDGGLGAVTAKNQIAIKDTLARGTLQAVRHANGEDWWVIVPKSHSNCYFLTLVNAEGVQPAVLHCMGKEWNDSDGGHSVFSPDATRYARMNFQNGLHIFDFDNATGELSNPIDIQFPDDHFPTNAGVSISSNSRFLYASARAKLYQFDLEANDIEGSKVQVAEWDGFENPYPTIFNLSALAPDGKIYIGSTSSHLNLHVIHYPDCPGLQCSVEQHGIDLPSYNFVSMPNFPHYRNAPTGVDCDAVVSTKEKRGIFPNISVFPNPTSGHLKLEMNESLRNGKILFYDLLGKRIASYPFENNITKLDLTELENGLFIYTIFSEGKVVGKGKILKVSP